MGTLRKMGAFLGLVPDEQRADHRAAGRYAGEEHDGHHGDGYADEHYEQAGYDRSDRGAGYDRADYDRADYAAYDADDQHAAGYRADSYHADEYDARYVADSDDADYHLERPAAAHRTAEPVGAGSSGLGGGYVSRGASAATSPYVHGALAVQAEPDLSPSADKATKPVTIKLTGFADARQVGESYRDGQAVILDMTELSDVEARRMVDFAAGLAFGRRGSIDKVTTKVFMLHQDEQPDH